MYGCLDKGNGSTICPSLPSRTACVNAVSKRTEDFIGHFFYNLYRAALITNDDCLTYIQQHILVRVHTCQSVRKQIKHFFVFLSHLY